MKAIQPSSVLKHIKKYRSQKYNTYVLLYLDINKNIISIHQKRFNDSEILSISELFIPAFYINAKFVIITKIEPNRKIIEAKENEKNLCLKINSSGKLFGINILDFILVSNNSYYSFHESHII